MPCQQTRFADPEGAGALMRSFAGTAEVTKKKRTGKGKQATTTRTTDHRGARQRRRVRRALRRRGAGPGRLPGRSRVVRRLPGAAGPAAVHRRGVAGRRRGHRADPALLEQVPRSDRGGRRPHRAAHRHHGGPLHRRPGRGRTAAAGLAAAVNAACGSPGAGACAGPPKVRPAVPSRSASRPASWPRSTCRRSPAPSVPGSAPTPSARVQLRVHPVRQHPVQGQGHEARPDPHLRVPRGSEADTFGLTQTVATMKGGQAATFVDDVRGRIRGCGQANLGTSVDMLVDRGGPDADLTVWDLDVEISDNRTIQFWMAIMRDGNAVSQVGFTPAAGMTMDRDDFTAVAERALERLSDLPSASPSRTAPATTITSSRVSQESPALEGSGHATTHPGRPARPRAGADRVQPAAARERSDTDSDPDPGTVVVVVHLVEPAPPPPRSPTTSRSPTG